jgi:hypothetical protein
MRFFVFLWLFFVFALAAETASAQPIALPNANFEKALPGATNAPADWTPGGIGETVWDQKGRGGSHAIGVLNGKKEESVFWKTSAENLQPNALYRLSFWSKGDGHIISGLNVANKDFVATPQWSFYRSVFIAPSTLEGAYLRLGQWNGGGELWFDDVRLVRLQPLFAQFGSTPGGSAWELGEGETIENETYRFNAPLQTSNFSRPLEFSSAGFNSNRWVLSGGAQIIFRHRIGGFVQKAARVSVGIGYYQSGKLIVEASRDGKEWTPLGELEKSGVVEADLPASLLPAPEIWVRLRATAAPRGTQDAAPGSFQINAYSFASSLPGAPDERGQTHFLENKSVPTEGFTARVETLGALRPGAENHARLKVNSDKAQAISAQLIFASQNDDKSPQKFEKKFTLATGENTIELPYDLRHAGDFTAQIFLRQNERALFSGEVDFSVPALYAADYGFRIGSLNDVWWSDATRKISRERPLPIASPQAGSTPEAGAGVVISAAKNEYEPFQVVARPAQNVRGLRVSAGALKSGGGAIIGNDNIEICEVAYVPVSQPTDALGVAGDWPDPLPPHRAPIDLQANQNQPFWITVRVPKNARAGIYRGTIQMSAVNWKREIPVQLTVRDFALTDETHVQSGFGLSAARVARYHNVSQPEDVARVMEKYYANFAAHRIAPYDPMQGAAIQVDWGLGGATNWSGGVQVGSTPDGFQPFAGESSFKVEDAKTNLSIAADFTKNIPVVVGQKYAFKFAVKTALAGQEFVVTLNTYDAGGKWISGNNLDWRQTGSGEWQEVSLDAGARLSKSPKAAQVASVRVSLRPVTWSESGDKTGVAWFDDVQLLNDKNENLISGGDFESATVSPAQVKLDFSAFDKAAKQAFETFHFSAFRLPLLGLGTGTFHSRKPGQIGAYQEGSPQYEVLLGSYLRQIQNHLEQKGRLDKAYVYWFDEPDEKDYDFVRAGMERIKKYAPKIRRLLTEQPEPALFGAVNLWCPVTSHFDEKTARERMQAGDDFWWYICTVPKTPFAGDFIDHPAVEPRVWLWQTWQQKVSGILMWETVYWTSNAAYPDELQNPWRDPMSWVSGYDTAEGVRRPWGNGDGRFLYPPNRHPNENKTPSFDAPINSIRWELLREGIEDYEYLWTLRETIARAKPLAKTAAQKTLIAHAEKLLTVPDGISRTLTQFTNSPAPILKQRNEIAKAIEAIQKFAP